MTRNVHAEWPSSRELAGGLPDRRTPAVHALPPAAGCALSSVGARHVYAGPNQQITVLGTRPTGRRDREGAV
ncbi:hypothetical protein [Streptomyces ureilyticus]|uniref:Uncharacterized protein n=1 Tax=Streptomyces ureilyticus TaxID=1775131 RepID=A0ABX0DP04_9ACTN|nr:hypothetical protein [Streptomyces ureilyticus]NGO43473.1 hypothetical protein [Streptomyces ureilyticus]